MWPVEALCGTAALGCDPPKAHAYFPEVERYDVFMPFDPIRLPILARQKEDENWRFRDFLKHRCRLSTKQLDTKVFQITERVWSQIDCTTCANCCKHIRPTLSEEDIDRLTARLGVTRDTFIETYLEPAEGDNPWHTKSIPCPFLKDNKCTVYEDRPDDCRGYPYLYEPEFSSRLIAMLERIETCPIVYEVFEDLKRAVGYRDRGGRR
jgi:uncharacterized protein